MKISEPTVTMTFQVNDSPFAGREGTYVTSRHLRARLMRELQTDVSLRVNDTDSTDAFEVCGRGELHLSILIENMRRQGYEFAVSKPRVIYQEIDGVKCEPIERLVVDTPQASAGAVIEKIGRRRGTLEHMSGLDRVRLEFLVPSRGLFGYRSEFMTDTRGEGIMSATFERYEPVKGDIPHRSVGALVAHETGHAVCGSGSEHLRGSDCRSERAPGRLGCERVQAEACDEHAQRFRFRGCDALDLRSSHDLGGVP